MRDPIADDLVARYWIAQNQPNYEFWQHEFSKHATCFSSFDTGFNGTNNCYGVTYQEGEDVVDFYETAALHYLKYPTFDWLSAANIVPSNTTTYKLSQIQDALSKASGALPYVRLNDERTEQNVDLRCCGILLSQIGCSGNRTANGRTVISEVWYYGHHVGKVVSIHVQITLRASAAIHHFR